MKIKITSIAGRVAEDVSIECDKTTEAIEILEALGYKQEDSEDEDNER